MTSPVGGYPDVAQLMAMRAELSSSVTGERSAPNLGGSVPTGGVGGPSFADRVGQALERVEGMGERADLASAGLVRGEHDDVHGTMIAMQEADIGFRLVTSVRNRVVEAYREVMRMGS